ncbi:hypothetical protein MLD38_040294 [Melastoma candidum]|uniref:Uncharacterized protein n=1 Tax=Melastoma candidum TaxID=119954 RepID=A0ACB9L659_9MYRT|nr:hypothetical protein MLD38_040294 [Melastoma candidum]
MYLLKQTISPDLKQKGVVSASLKVPKFEKSDGLKLLFATTASVVSSRTRFKRKDAETEEIDEVLADGDLSTVDPSDRQLTASKRVDFAWFSANMLDIAPMFKALGLKTFCESYAEVSVAKVLVFYSNLNFYRDGRSIKFIRTSVNGVTLVYSALDVCNFYGCDSTAELQDFEKNEAFSIIVSLLPRARSIDTIMPAYAKVMVHLLKGIPFSLGALIFRHMEWSLSRKEKSQPYGQGKKHAKGPPASQKGSAPSAVKASASSALPSVLKELQLQVAAKGEDIRVLQRLIMDALRQLEGLDKFLHEKLDA